MDKQIYRVRGEPTVSTPETKASIRTVVLPPEVVAVLTAHRATVESRWMFPSPVKEDSSYDPAWIRKKMHMVLEHAQCKQLRFHDLRHTFSTTALEHGMDVKTLSAILGHVSAATTLDIYTHITDTMQKKAAASIDRGIGKVEPTAADAVPVKSDESPRTVPFLPYKGKKRKPGTGCISQVSENCWEGRYSPVWPDGKKHSRNIYGKAREECEEKLKVLIVEMKAEIAEVQRLKDLGEEDGEPPKGKKGKRGKQKNPSHGYRVIDTHGCAFQKCGRFIACK